MASTSDRRGTGRLKFKSSSPCFFKIILQDTIQNGKLDIPKKFVKNHGKYISSPALLRVPSGEVWKVELTKSDGKVWLENGWLQFSNHFSLGFGDLLVFRYDGKSNFHVVIFDTSASEIQYPLTATGINNERSDEIPEQNINEDSTQIRKPQLPCPRPHEMISTNAAIKMETECNEESGFLPQQDGHNGCPARNGDKSTSHNTLKAHERVNALERASNTFKSENPFFLAVMQPSYVGLDRSKKYRLCIPLNFAEKHLMKEHCSVILCNLSGKTWSVDFKSRRLGGKLRSYLLAGWGDFVRDNNIEAGDVCAFELINSIDISFRVVIYHGQHANFHPLVASTDVFHPVKQEASSYASLEPLTNNDNSLFFEIQEQNINGSKGDETIKTLENISPSKKKREKSQLTCPRPLKMIRSTNSAIKTEAECIGKSEFVAQQLRLHGNQAREGDKRTSYHAVHRLNNHEKVEALERATNTFKSENPFFLAVMQPYYVGCSADKKFRLSIPTNFAKEHLMKEHCSVTLSNSSGKTWTTTFKQSQRGKKLDAMLQTGWRTFVQDNNIQVGDVCAFELINSIEISFRVVIFQGQHANYRSLVSTDVVRPVKRNAPSSSCASPSCPKPLTDLKKAKALPIANAFKSENPFFVIVLQPSYVNSYRLSIPANFAREYLSRMHKEVILLLSNGKSWPVIYHQHHIEGSKPSIIFGNGWRKFSGDNNLQVGDTCVFELVEGAETSMNVTIYKKQPDEDANLGSSMDDNGRGQQVELRERSVIKTEESTWMKEKGDMSNLLVDYNCDASGKILDDMLMSTINYPGKTLEEATQSYQALPENEATQDTNWLER